MMHDETKDALFDPVIFPGGVDPLTPTTMPREPLNGPKTAFETGVPDSASTVDQRWAMPIFPGIDILSPRLGRLFHPCFPAVRSGFAE